MILINAVFSRIDASERIDPAKRNGSRKCIVSHYWFSDCGFKFEDSICNVSV